MTAPSEQRPDDIEIESLGGNCPVQAEGTFDGEPFYFRARGTQVTCDVGPGVKERDAESWEWRGPEYEWPDAGWISEETARAFISEAYRRWKGRNTPTGAALYRLRNGKSESGMQAIWFAAQIDREVGEAGKPASQWLMAYAQKQMEGRR